MDYSLSSYPWASDTDYFPSNDNFFDPDTSHETNVADVYNAQPDHACDALFDSDTLSPTLNPLETSFSLTPRSQFLSNTQPNLSRWPNTPLVPFGYLEISNNAINTNPTLNNIPDPFTSLETSPCELSSTPSICNEKSQSRGNLTSGETSDEAASPDVDEPSPMNAPRKRGRPRLDQTTDSKTSASGSKARAGQRLPHNQVERKYREGLNAELERLRRAVPTLIQQDTGCLTGPLKPSKATILATAVEYIKKVELDRDALKEENDNLRALEPAAPYG